MNIYRNLGRRLRKASPDKAKAAARQIGAVTVDMGETACKVPAPTVTSKRSKPWAASARSARPCAARLAGPTTFTYIHGVSRGRYAQDAESGDCAGTNARRFLFGLLAQVTHRHAGIRMNTSKRLGAPYESHLHSITRPICIQAARPFSLDQPGTEKGKNDL